MFYSKEILTSKKNGGFGVIWLAATLGPKSQTKKLTKKDYLRVDIPEACEFLSHPPEPLALRLTSSLMLGLIRVYNQQYQFHFMDVQTLWMSLQRQFFVKDFSKSIDLPPNDANLKLDEELADFKLVFDHSLQKINTVDRDNIFQVSFYPASPMVETPERIRQANAEKGALSGIRMPSMDPLPFNLTSEGKGSTSFAIEDYGFQDVELSELGLWSEKGELNSLNIPDYNDDHDNPFFLNTGRPLVPVKKAVKKAKKVISLSDRTIEIPTEEIIHSFTTLEEELTAHRHKENKRFIMKIVKDYAASSLVDPPYAFIQNEAAHEIYQSLHPPVTEQHFNEDAYMPQMMDDLDPLPEIFRDDAPTSSSLMAEKKASLPWSSPARHSSLSSIQRPQSVYLSTPRLKLLIKSQYYINRSTQKDQ